MLQPQLSNLIDKFQLAEICSEIKYFTMEDEKKMDYNIHVYIIRRYIENSNKHQ